MADLSKIILPNNSELTLKDNSQEHSAHNHYDSDIVPLVHKKYESTSYYATTSSSYETSTWYFMSVRPDDWYKPWRVKFKVYSYCPKESSGTLSYPSYKSYTWATVTGRADSTAYANWNERCDTAHYYTTVYPLKKTGFDAGYSHALGISIIYGSGYTNSNCYRTFEIDYYECENCTVTILDTPVKWASWTGTGTTNYNNLVVMDAVNRGLKETGDDNTVTENRIGYFAGKTGSKGIWASSLFMEDVNGTYQNICTASDGTVTSSNRTTATTKIANTNGFKVLGTIWYTSTNYAANTNISGNAVIYSATSLFDSRYAFNTTLTANSLTPYKEVYLVGTIHDDGLFYLDSTWWTQTPNDTSKVYVLVGACFDSNTSYCRVTLYEQNKWYRYDGTKLVEISGDAQTVNGHTVESDVPSGAVFTDTKNTAGSTDTSSKIYLIGATEQSANPQTYSDDQVYTQNGTFYAKNHVVANPDGRVVAALIYDRNHGGQYNLWDANGELCIWAVAAAKQFNSTGSIHILERIDGKTHRRVRHTVDEVNHMGESTWLDGNDVANVTITGDGNITCSDTVTAPNFVGDLKGNASAVFTYATGTSDTAGRWTVTIPGITQLYDGLTIRVFLSTSYNSTFNTLNVNGLGDNLVWFRQDTRLTSHMPRYACIDLTYKESGMSNYNISNAYCDPINNANYRGDWAANTAYAIGDSVLYSSKYYICKTAHTSGASWASGNWNASTTPYTDLPSPTSATTGVTYGWLMQTAYDTNDTSTIRPYYSHVTAGGNGIKQYSVFAALPDGTYSSFTTNSGTETKTYDTTHYFDIRKLFAYNGSGNIAVGSKIGNNTLVMCQNTIDGRYTFNGIVISDATTLVSEQPVYVIFDKTAESSGCYKLKSPYWTQTPNDTSAIYVLMGYSTGKYQIDLWMCNPAYTYDGTKLVPFGSGGGSVSSLSNLTDVDVTGAQSGDILSYDGSGWVNSNGISLRPTGSSRAEVNVSAASNGGTILLGNGNGHNTIILASNSSTNSGYVQVNDANGSSKFSAWVSSFDSGATTRGNIYLYDENNISRIKMYGDGGIVLCDTNQSTTVDLDSSNSKVSTFSGTANVSPKFRAYRSDTDIGVSLQVDADGERNGVYSETYEGYLIHSDLLQRIYIGEKLNGSTELWEGTLSSGSTTFPATYDFYIIEGDITNNASRYTAAVIPKSIIDSGTGKQYCYADESKYITFTIGRTNDIITLAIGSKTGTGGIRRIIGVN